jgi:hypothetical protein
LRQRRGVDSRIVATVAFLVAALAIALEIAYLIGNFVMHTVQQIP